MLSILIPTYNFDCTALARELQRQITASGITAEVIVMDDASPRHELRMTNTVINELPDCRLVQLPHNVGIARIRNLLADEARYEYLLFLDSDVFPVSDDFITRYINNRDKADVVCGGLMFRATPPSPQCTLRYKYGSKVESQSVDKRMQQPYGEFRTLNFFISRKAFMNTRFNEQFVRYGHEPSLARSCNKRATPLCTSTTPYITTYPTPTSSSYPRPAAVSRICANITTSCSRMSSCCVCTTSYTAIT